MPGRSLQWRPTAVGELNNLRRRAAGELEEKILGLYRRAGRERTRSAKPQWVVPRPEETQVRIAVDTFAQFKTALSYEEAAAIYLNLSYLTDEQLEQVLRIMREELSCPPVFAALPPVLRQRMKKDLEDRLRAMSPLYNQ